MYYDGNTGQYLVYDSESKTYKYDSSNTRSDTTIAKFNVTSSQKKRKTKQGEKKVCLLSMFKIF